MRPAAMAMMVAAGVAVSCTAVSLAAEPLPTTAPTTRPATAPAAAAPAEWTDRSSPVAAMKLAILMNRGAGALSLDDLYYADGDAASERFLVAASSASSAADRLKDAVIGRFGIDGARRSGFALPDRAKAENDLRQMGDRALAYVDKLVVTIDGDHATLTAPPGEAAGRPVRLRRIGGVWKLRFADVSGGVELRGDFPGYRQPVATLESFRLAAARDADLATAVRAGRFDSADAVRAARAERSRAIVTELDRFKVPD